MQKNEENRWDANLTSAHKWVNNKSTDFMIRDAYMKHGISSTDQIEDSMRKVFITDPPPKRVRS